MKRFSVEFKLSDSEFMTALRLVAGAVCSAADVDVDTLEDFKVCVTESALVLKNCGFETVKAVFEIDGGVGVQLSGNGGQPAEGDNELSLALIGALVSEFDVVKNGKAIDKVILRI